jgi:hypothetical protein
VLPLGAGIQQGSCTINGVSAETHVLASVAPRANFSRMSEAVVIHIIADDEFDARGAR